MPYVPNSERQKSNDGVLPNAGVLNYTVHQLIDEYFKQNGRNYQTINDVIGVMDCVKMELYRRMVSEYEEIKILQLEFSDKQLLQYMLAAHEADMSFNQFVNTVIREFLEQHEEKQEK